MNGPLNRRRGGAVWIVLSDLVRDAWWTRNWLVATAVVLAVLAAVLAVFGQTVLPWTIYPAL